MYGLSAIGRTFSIAILSAQPLLSLNFAAAASSSPAQRAFSSSSIAKMSEGNYVAGDLTAQTSQRIQDAFDLFGAKPSHAIFKRSWSPDAIFEDPICYAVGERQYKAQWWGMPAAFGKSELLAWHVEKDDPREIRYVQKQRYHVRGIGVQKEMLSTVVMKLDEQGKITHFQDLWDHKEPPTNFIAWPLRRLNALVMPYLITVPKEDSSKADKGRKDL